MTLTRREALLSLGLGAMAIRPSAVQAADGARLPARHRTTGSPTRPYSLPPLPYPAAALEPHIDARTMEIHHGRHHQTYVDNLNAALKDAPELAGKPIETVLANLQALPEPVRTAIRNNGGGHVNHQQFWTVMAPHAGGPPTGAIADALTSTFGSVEKFKELFNQAATARFGSGWAWLSDDHGKLIVHTTANQDSPLMDGQRPIFGLDVWEHAYYLKYQNRRPDYITAWWNLIDWTEVNKRLKS